MGGLSHARPLYNSEKDPLPIVYEAGLTPGTVLTNVKNLVPPGFNSRTVYTLASRYTY
jgi:hypothetical protein